MVQTAMEGVEFQLRQHDDPSSRGYPLSFDQRIAHGDAFRSTKDALEARLKSIETFYASEAAESHTSTPDCNACLSRKRQIRQAFLEYYLPNEAQRWNSGLHEYRATVDSMTKDESRYSLRDVQNVHDDALRNHLKQDMCASLSSDSPETYTFKRMLSEIFDSKRPLEEIIDAYSRGQLSAAGSQEAHDFVDQLQGTTNAEDRVDIYTKYYCSPHWNDSTLVKNFKAKHARQFAELATHDTVVANMHEEAAKSQSQQLDKLKSELNDFQMAKSATMKHKKRRAEQADQRMLDRDTEETRYVHCGLPGCHRDVDLSEETVECGLCDWLATKDASSKRVYYCSTEHAEEDFDEHDRNDHQCCMEQRCFFDPQPGPPGETGAGGICRDCARHGHTNYFCSQRCYKYNLESHRDLIHRAKQFESDSDQLETFRPADDLKLVS